MGGLILFEKNIVNPPQLRALTRFLISAEAPALPFLAVDEEGGSVERLVRRKGFTYHRGARLTRRHLNPAKAYEAYLAMAVELSSAGLNLNLGPVVDLELNPDNPIVARTGRSYGVHPLAVARYAASFVEAHRRLHLVTALKHWPGHGSSSRDSHLQFVDVTRQWQPVEIEPFRRLVHADLADMVMSAHIHHDSWGDAAGRPASLSASAIARLRDEVGFDGVVVTDDLQMRAVLSRQSLAEAIVLALKAGNDMVLIGNALVSEPTRADFAVEVIERAVAEGELDFGRLLRSYRRVMALKSRLKPPHRETQWPDR